jgi:trk system potassium uptake protein TrkH
MTARVLGRVMLLGAAALTLPLAASLIYSDGAAGAFLLTAALLAAPGAAAALLLRKPKTGMQPRDGFAAVALCWLVLSLFGALPAVLTGDIPNYIDSLFEAVSGFTTTGATIMTDIESARPSILFWRSFTHWIGGMGVLVLALAVMPADERGLHNLVKAESTGPSSDRIAPRLRGAAARLYLIYVSLTAVLFVMLAAGGMSVFDALIHTFGTAGTGGFSNRALSVGAYESSYIEIVITVFMLLFSVNFSVFYAALTRRLAQIRKNTELKVFLCVTLVSGGLIALNLTSANAYGGFAETARHSFFQVASLMSTTGYATTDFNVWPEFSKTVLALLMIVGACAGSTGGGLKISRAVILLKSSFRELKQIIHPRSVNVVRIDGRAAPDTLAAGVMHFFAAYMLLIFFGALIVSLDGFGFETSFSSALSAISNVGPGFGAVGPLYTFADFSPLSKVTLAFCMLAGRLEIFPMLLLFTPSVWRR